MTSDPQSADLSGEVWHRAKIMLFAQPVRLWWCIAGALCLILGIALTTSLPAINATLISPVGLFFYPLEVEWREGSFWLDALALIEKAPIYDHSAFAYVSMAHGPMDSLVKSWIARLFPLLAPWQVTRFFVVLLPITLASCSAVIVRGNVRLPWLWGALVGLTFYVAILVAPGGNWFLYGRTDSTALVFAVAAVTLLHLAVQSSGSITRIGCSFAAGLLLGASYLTIWRNFPVMGAMVLAAVLAVGLRTRRWQPAGTVMLCCIAGAFAIFLVILFGLMGGSSHLFWEHFYKLFLVSYDTSAANRGFLGVPQDIWDDLAPGWDAFTQDRNGLTRRLAIIVLCPVLLIGTAWWPVRQRFAYLRSTTFIAVLLVLYGLAILSLAVGYLVHWRAGTLSYLAPIYLMSWYMICLSLIARPFASEAIRGGLSVLLTCEIILLLAVYPQRATSPGIESAHAIALTDAARAFDFQLDQLKKKYSVVSDAYHFFKRKLDPTDLVDQGDFSWSFAKEGHFGPAFSDTVRRYIAAIERNPPDIVIVGPISSPPLKALVQQRYRCIVCGVLFYPYEGHGYSLYARNDLPIDELRAQFSMFSSTPSPPPGK